MLRRLGAVALFVAQSQLLLLAVPWLQHGDCVCSQEVCVCGHGQTRPATVSCHEEQAPVGPSLRGCLPIRAADLLLAPLAVLPAPPSLVAERIADPVSSLERRGPVSHAPAPEPPPPRASFAS